MEDVKFTIKFTFGVFYKKKFSGLLFKDCKDVNDVRSWFNGKNKFINIKGMVINMDKVLFFEAVED